MFKLCPFFASTKFKSVFESALYVAVNSRRYSNISDLKYKCPPILLVLRNCQNRLNLRTVQLFHNSAGIRAKKIKDDVDEFDEKKSLMYYQEFEKSEEKNKKTFLETVKFYKAHVKNRAGHVDFIKAALKNMKSYGVHRDKECYKKILDVLPKGVYISKNKWLAASMYFPRQQYAVMDLLDQMGNNGVWFDAELGMMIINIFGKNSIVNQKFENMMYWSVKWRHKSPFILPEITPSDTFLLAEMAIKRITSVDPQTEISLLQTNTLKDSIDKTWIISGQSPKQKKLLQEHSHKEPVIVEGGDLVWLRDKCVNYFVLKAYGRPLPFVYPEDTSDISNMKSKFFNPDYKEEKKKEPSVHEQDDGIIYAVCATGTSSKDSLLSWVRLLEAMGNSVLADVPVLFRFHEKEKFPATTSEALVNKDEFECEPPVAHAGVNVLKISS